MQIAIQLGLFSLCLLLSVSGRSQVCNSYKTSNFPSLHFTSIDFSSEATGYAVSWSYPVGPSGKLVKTIDGGENWFSMQSFSDYLQAVKFINDSIGFISGRNDADDKGYIFKTVDGGMNWKAVSFQGENDVIFDIDFFNDLIGYAVGVKSILKTVNGGETWIIQDTLISRSHSDIHIINADTLYVADNSGNILKTIDGGVSWNKVFSNRACGFTSLTFITPKQGFAAGSQASNPDDINTQRWGIMYVTNDYGSTWTPLNRGISCKGSKVWFNGAGTIFWNDYLSISASKDTAKSWTLYAKPDPNGYAICDVFQTPSGTTFLAGDQQIYKVSCNNESDSASVNTNTTSIINNYHSSSAFSIYPNPTQGAFTLKISTPSQVRVFNNLGSQVSAISVNDKETNIDLGAVTKGIYYVEVFSGKVRSTQKLVVE